MARGADTASTTTFLVSCVSQKSATAVPAKDLYRSQWFLKARAYVEARNAPWFILSAEHGLVHPDAILAPYEKTLNRMRLGERRVWASRVLQQIQKTVPFATRIEFLAGKRYREFLMDPLRQQYSHVSAPMKGLRIGNQLQWLNKHTR